MCEIWVEGPWKTEIDGKGVRITYASGRETFVRRMSRGDYREGLESALRRLNEYELAEQCVVVPIGKRQRGH